MVEIKDLVRSNILKLVPYSSARNEFAGAPDVILLDANESPYNTPYNRYPDPGQNLLRQKLAGMYGLTAKQVFTGNGSDEAIDLLFRIFCNPGKERAISIDPSYGMYGVTAGINDIAVDLVSLRPDFSLAGDAILHAVVPGTKLVFLCSPNNPGSNLLEEKEILNILDNFNGIVVVDEAYIDFSGSRGLIHLLGTYKRLVILRTLSKAWGAAGIRLGIALADPEIIGFMDKVKYPYNVNQLTLDRALELLGKPELKESWVELILEEREKLIRELAKLDLVKEILPSDANFLMIRVSDPVSVYDYLAGNGIIVRNRSGMTHCEGCLRITIGTEEENRELMKALKSYGNA